MAPSPTGPFHIGSARTALFNYLFAKKYEGKFIVRIEDTDLERSKPEWEENIKESLSWLGLDYDEGPDKVGEFGPYRQSERKTVYRKYIEKLIETKQAYHCFCSIEELEAHRQYLVSQGLPPVYSEKCQGLSQIEAEKKKTAGEQCVIRFRTPKKGVVLEDLLKGRIEYDAATFGDMVIAKDLETPLYNLACVIDDFEMKISHVLRGEEHLSNTPKQILLAWALGIKPPQFLHLPLILNQQRAKLSKRDPSIAAKVSDYKEQGYLPEAVVNFIALLGWNPGDDREVFSLAELVKEFSIEKLQTSGAVFNVQKLDWLNGFYIRKMPLVELTNRCVPFLIQSGLIAPLWGKAEAVPLVYSSDFTVLEYEAVETKGRHKFSDLARIVALYQERLKKLIEVSELINFFFQKELDYPGELLVWKKVEKGELGPALAQLETLFSKIKEGDWIKEKLEKVIMPEAEKTGDRGRLLWPLRVALSGKQASAGPFEIAEVLGKQKTIQRIKQAQEKV
jgi:glutamyl-tRNA synthetase